MDVLKKVKLLLGNIDDKDDLLGLIVELTGNRLKVILNEYEVPEELEYILVEVCVKRYNRIGSEGVSSHTVEGESMTFSDDDFKDFADDILEWQSHQADKQKGHLRFL